MKGFEQAKKEEFKSLLEEDDELLELFENNEIIEDFEVIDDAPKRNYSSYLVIN